MCYSSLNTANSRCDRNERRRSILPVFLLVYFYVGAGIAQCSDCATGWTIWGTNPGKRKRGFLFS